MPAAAETIQKRETIVSQTPIPIAQQTDAQLALSMLIRHVHRIAARQAARVASGDATPQQACAAVIQHGTSLAITAHYFGADDVADAIATAVDQEAARLNPDWHDGSGSIGAAGVPA
ncbi:hypothetical protein QZM82_31855 [Burkholderia cepacia]|uniref:hypothetical protein n=1 Tax=Burkholderia cepacia TaxID=292 RepID=UPI00264A57A4|nr:hypothetical protein [Burkholderia cepacia]MDN7900795.1 hypothetical protein [Burkholderia cepacia]